MTSHAVTFTLQAWRERVWAKHDRMLKQAHKEGKPHDEIERMQHQRYTDDIEFEGEIAELWTRHLLRRIGWYHLPYPNGDDWAEERQPFYHHHLTREAIVRVRREIRAEQKELWERRARWLPLVTALTGLLGTVIGVIAAFKH